MKYLITGHKGFIGTNLVNYLQDRGEHVVGLDIDDCDLCNGYPTILMDLKYHIDIVVHLAAETSVLRSIGTPDWAFLRNCESTVKMLEFARSKNAKFIFISSCGAQNPINPYAASKVAGEALCQAYRKSYNMDISILRLSNVYGPHSNHKDSVIAKFIKQKLANEPVTINGSGHQKRDFVHVDDVCKAIHECSEDFAEISTGKLTSINTLVELLKIDKVIYDSPIEGEIFHPETQRYKDLMIQLENGLESTLNWFQEN